MRTPEQEAFYEYGRAVEAVKNRWIAMHEYRSQKKRGIALMLKDYLVKGIRIAKQKRAMCRRMCGQCVHFSPDEWGVGKDGCLKRVCRRKNNHCSVNCRYWKPRKEE